jgi:hypothetical protein
LKAENANYDPHGFKAQGQNTPVSAFPDPQVPYAAFPTTVYRENKTVVKKMVAPAPVEVSETLVTTESRVVKSQDELDAAIADGFSAKGVSDGSGTDRYGSGPDNWTFSSDGKDYPGSYGVGVDQAPVPFEPTAEERAAAQ